ncbi:MAG: glycosyltransferase, partial [Bacteroidota bacterium]
MKILYYSPHPHLRLNAPTGYGTHMREMIAAFRRKGVEVRTLIAGDTNENEYGESKPSKFASFKRYIPSKFWETAKDYQLLQFDKKLEAQLEQTIKEFQPDFIYERVAYLQNSGVKLAGKFGVKHISEINAPYPEERIYFSGQTFFENQAKDIEREILVKSDLITTVSHDLKVHLEKKLTDVEAKIMVIPNSVNPSESTHSKESVNKIKEAYKLQDKTVIGFVGSIFPYHGVDIMIKAFSDLENRHNATLLIVGDGEAVSDLKALARKLGVLSSCIFTGSIPH